MNPINEFLNNYKKNISTLSFKSTNDPNFNMVSSFIKQLSKKYFLKNETKEYYYSIIVSLFANYRSHIYNDNFYFDNDELIEHCIQYLKYILDYIDKNYKFDRIRIVDKYLNNSIGEIEYLLEDGTYLNINEISKKTPELKIENLPLNLLSKFDKKYLRLYNLNKIL